MMAYYSTSFASSKQVSCFLVTLATICMLSVEHASGHGHMVVPPMRSSMWRQGFPVPVNYDDTSLWCGGFGSQYGPVNQGRCGECGDNWADNRPRANDEGGTYGTGIIGRTYTQGQTIDVTVNITVNLGGFFEFRLCASKTSSSQLVTQDCLDQTQLQFENNSYRYILGYDDKGPAGNVNLRVRLPAGVTCQYCVLQWWWKTNINNNCGSAPQPEAGCGDQEQYKNCADIAITTIG